MPTGHDDKDELKLEEVERRREVRGIFPGLQIALVGGHPATFDAVEGSRRGFFVSVQDPDGFKLGEINEAVIALGERQAKCRLEVIRKEIEPRRGVALRISFIDPQNEEMLKTILGPAG